MVQVCLGQKVFKINEGDLQFIHAEEGIYLMKNDVVYQLRIKNIDDYETLSGGIKYELSASNLAEIEKIRKDASTVLGSEIVKFDFKKLDRQKFTTQNNDDDNYRIYKYNKNFFSIAELEDSIQKPVSRHLLHYCILDFGNDKRILCFPKGFIVPTKEKLRFLFDDRNLNDSYANGYVTTPLRTLTASEIHSTQDSELVLNGDFYRIDTLKNKQLKIRTIYNEDGIKRAFDSIFFNTRFIVGYKKDKIEIYNYTFQKLKLKKITSFSFGKFEPSMQIIENHELKTINLTGTAYKPSDASYQMSFNHFFPNRECHFKIVKKEDYFYFETDNISSIITNFQGYERSFKMQNSNEFETVQFFDQPLSFYTLDSEMMGFTLKNPIVIYTKLKNGKFNLNSLEYLLTENPSKEIETYDKQLPKNCDTISELNQLTFLIEKEGLFTYYPIMKAIKYKKIEDFKGNYARFELPNGQKGWLTLDGKEYLD